MISCHSVPVPTARASPIPSGSASALGPDGVATPTETYLPSGLATQSADYCKSPYAFLPVEDGNDISENEIAYKLGEIWLRRYKTPIAPVACRIADYRIDRVYDDPEVYAQALDPKGNFMRVAMFSVKRIQVTSNWMSFSGEPDQQNWLHLRQVMAIFKVNGGYTMQFAFP